MTVIVEPSAKRLACSVREGAKDEIFWSTFILSITDQQ